MTDPDEVRGDLSNPVVALQAEFGEALDRYAEVTASEPAYVAALLVEYADTIREEHDVEVEVGRITDGIWIAQFDGQHTGWLGAPRSGAYGDVDVEHMSEELGLDVQDEGVSVEEVDLVDRSEVTEDHDG